MTDRNERENWAFDPPDPIGKPAGWYAVGRYWYDEEGWIMDAEYWAGEQWEDPVNTGIRCYLPLPYETQAEAEAAADARGLD